MTIRRTRQGSHRPASIAALGSRHAGLWLRLGQIPSLVAFVGLFVVLLVVSRPFVGDTTTTIGITGFALFVAYCVARPDRRVEVFSYGCMPGAGGTLLHDIFGISRLWGLATLVLALPGLRAIDREPADPDDPSLGRPMAP